MWFGTQDGLNRYDGRTFRIFKSSDGEGALPNSAITCLLEDSRGDLWVGTDGGLARLDPNGRTFTTFLHDPNNANSLSDDRIHALIEMPAGVLWVGTLAGGLNRFDIDAGSFESFRHDPEDPSSIGADRVRSLSVDGQGTLWIGTIPGGLNRLEPDGHSFVRFRHRPEDPNSLDDDAVRSIVSAADGHLWIGTNRGLNRFDPTTGSFRRFQHDPQDSGSLSEHEAWVVFQDSGERLWVGTDGGLNLLRNEAQGSFEHYRHLALRTHSLAADRVRAVYEDRGSVMWVGTSRGISRWNPTTGSFPHIDHDPTAKNSTLSDNAVHSFAERLDGKVWVGTLGGGLNLYDPASGTFRVYRHDAQDPQSLSGDRVMSLLIDSRGDLWVGTRSGLNRFLPDSETFQRFVSLPDDPTSLSADGITSLAEGPAGAIWVGTFGGGLNRLDPRTGGVKRFRHREGDPSSLSMDRVMCLLLGRDGLWLGTEGGLDHFDFAEQLFSHYRNEPGNARSLSSDLVVSLLEDQRGDLWAGTLGGGINRWKAEDREAGRVVFNHYREADGLPNLGVFGLLEDDAGQIWVSTNRGLARFDPIAETFKTYDTSHGLQSADFNSGAYHKGSSGKLYFGGSNGFNVFAHGDVKDNGHKPPVVLTNLLIFNEPAVLEERLSELDEIELTHRQSVVTFEFAALDYTAPQNNRYSYILEPFEARWNDVGSINRATYTNLPPGRYTFRVRGSNNDGLWNDEGLALSVRVRPPPWRAPWAYGLYAVALVGAMGGYTRAQRKKLEHEAEYSAKLKNEVRSRTEELEERNEQLLHLNERLEAASLTDALTGLRNRRYLLNFIQNDVAGIERDYEHALESAGDLPGLLFLMIDLDGFKAINDRWGHAAGDRVLVQATEKLRGACRKADTLIRWGGDEFLVIGRSTSPESAAALADRILEALSSADCDLGLAGASVKIGCSIGFSPYPLSRSQPGLLDWEETLRVADRALYAAKSSGRNQWVGIRGTSRLPTEATLLQLTEVPERLVAENAIEVFTSLPAIGDIVWRPRSDPEALSGLDSLDQAG